MSELTINRHDNVISLPAARPARPPWWAQYITEVRFADGGRHGDLLDCYGLARRIYAELVGITLAEWPLITSEVLTESNGSLLEARFQTGFKPVQMGLEEVFDIAVIRRALQVDGKARRGWWHVGVVTRPGHLIHVDYHQGVVEVAFRDTAAARGSATMRERDVRLFRHEMMEGLSVAAAMQAGGAA